MNVTIHEYEAVVAERDKEKAARIEAQAKVQKLTEERNNAGLAIDRALSGVVHDHPLACRLHAIADMRADLDRAKQALRDKTLEAEELQRNLDIADGVIEMRRLCIEDLQKRIDELLQAAKGAKCTT